MTQKVSNIEVAGLRTCLSLNRGYVSFSSPLFRSYAEWTEALRSTRFTPIEVLAVGKGFAYVVIDPGQEELLLPLSVKRYTALLQDLRRENEALSVLLGIGDVRTPPVGTAVDAKGFILTDTPPTKNSPTPPVLRGALRYFRSLILKARKGDLPVRRGIHVFATMLTNNCQMVEGRVVLTRDNVSPLVLGWGLYLSQILGYPLKRTFRKDLYSVATVWKGLMLRHGPLFLARYLKVSQFCIQKYLAGTPLTFTGELGIFVGLSRSGLPTWIPVAWRKAILCKNTKILRLVISLTTMYKVIHVPAKVVSVANIIRPMPPLAGHDLTWSGFVFYFLREWNHIVTDVTGTSVLKLRRPLASTKAGPNISPAGLGLFIDAKAWVNLGIENPLFNYLRAWNRLDIIKVVNDLALELPVFAKHLQEILVDPYYKTLVSGRVIKVEKSKVKGVSPKKEYDPTVPLVTGKITFIIEAAGKVRTIAIGDIISQWVLKPIHDGIFALLREWSSVDATFDQQGAVDNFGKRGYKKVYSFDLSAATDTIPHCLYLPVLQGLFNHKIAKACLALLVDRVYDVVLPDKGVTIKEGFKSVRYNRGQPMGMYSSWGLLAVTHHMMVQFAARKVINSLGKIPPDWREGVLPFNDYLVLGDDIVIACPMVADEYVKLCDRQYVILNETKSLSSDIGYMNFASQNVRDGENFSPASFKDHLQVTSLTQRVAQLSQLAKRGFFGEQLKLGSLIRGLFTPSVWRSRIRASYRLGELTYPLRIGIAALANAQMFPSLHYTSPFLIGYLPSITGIERHFKDMLYGVSRGAESSSHFISFWAEVIASTFSSELTLKCLEGIVSSQETANARLRVYASLKPFLNELDDNVLFMKMVNEGAYGQVERLRRKMLLYRLDRSSPSGVTFNRGFQSLDALLHAISHDISIYMEIQSMGGYLFRVPKDAPTVYNTGQHIWRDVLLGGSAIANPRPLELSQLLSRLQRKVKPLLAECEQSGRSIQWIVASNVTTASTGDHTGTQP